MTARIATKVLVERMAEEAVEWRWMMEKHT
jgi:hypothetical protein